MVDHARPKLLIMGMAPLMPLSFQTIVVVTKSMLNTQVRMFLKHLSLFRPTLLEM